MLRTAYKALAAASLIFAANAQAVVIDFENDTSGNPLSAGDVITTQYSAAGATFSTDANTLNPSTGYPAGSPAHLMIFDSAHPTGDDADLRTPGRGPNNTAAQNNILIISEDNDATDPDDHASGGNIIIDFDYDVFFEEVSFLDIEETNASTITFYDQFAAQIGDVFQVPGAGNNGFETVETLTSGVRSAVIHLSGSGAITGLRYSTASVPEPSMPMLLGLGFMAIVSLRQRAARAQH